MRNECSDGFSLNQVPQTEGLVPTAGESKVSIGGESQVTDGTVVTRQRLLGDTWNLRVRGELPNLDTLVTRTSDDLVGVGVTNGDTSNPVGVTL